jgi:hypothetical protein
MALKRRTYTLPLAADAMCERVGGRKGCAEAWGVSPSRTALGADLGGSSKYSNENFED